MFLYKNLFFFNIFYSFNPSHAYWNQRRLFSGNLPGMFLLYLYSRLLFFARLLSRSIFSLYLSIYLSFFLFFLSIILFFRCLLGLWFLSPFLFSTRFNQVLLSCVSENTLSFVIDRFGFSVVFSVTAQLLLNKAKKVNVFDNFLLSLDAILFGMSIYTLSKSF